MSLPVFWQALCLCINPQKIDVFEKGEREKVQALTKSFCAFV